jgi:hypothetical protein
VKSRTEDEDVTARLLGTFAKSRLSTSCSFLHALSSGPSPSFERHFFSCPFILFALAGLWSLPSFRVAYTSGKIRRLHSPHLRQSATRPTTCAIWPGCSRAHNVSGLITWHVLHLHAEAGARCLAHTGVDARVETTINTCEIAEPGQACIAAVAKLWFSR